MSYFCVDLTCSYVKIIKQPTMEVPRETAWENDSNTHHRATTILELVWAATVISWTLLSQNFTFWRFFDNHAFICFCLFLWLRLRRVREVELSKRVRACACPQTENCKQNKNKRNKIERNLKWICEKVKNLNLRLCFRFS